MVFDSNTLRTAIPYIQKFKNQCFVIKLGGELCEPGPGLYALLEQIVLLQQLGIQTVVVHGGGPQIQSLSARLGIEEKKVAGRRITDSQTLEVVTMTLAGTINTNLLAALRKLGADAVGFTGIDGELITASRREPLTQASGEKIVYGEVGDITAIQTKLIHDTLKQGRIPVIASLACTNHGEILNINADTVAAALAIELAASKLIFLLNVDGVYEQKDNPNSLISIIKENEIDNYIEREVITDGMLPKITSARMALQAGVKRVHLLSGLARDALLREVFTNEGAGTLICNE